MMTKQDIQYQILMVSQHLMQTKGYNAFSYRDIADIVGIKTSSIHYHFPAKADLGKAVMKMHTEMLLGELNSLLANPDFSIKKKLEVFIDTIYTTTYFDESKMCLGGMLAADILTLPEGMQQEVRHFFKELKEWLALLLAANKQPQKDAQAILTMIEGSLLLARLYQDNHILEEAKERILKV